MFTIYQSILIDTYVEFSKSDGLQNQYAQFGIFGNGNYDFYYFILEFHIKIYHKLYKKKKTKNISNKDIYKTML